jgi:hypothetical protein
MLTASTRLLWPGILLLWCCLSVQGTLLTGVTATRNPAVLFIDGISGNSIDGLFGSSSDSTTRMGGIFLNDFSWTYAANAASGWDTQTEDTLKTYFFNLIQDSNFGAVRSQGGSIARNPYSTCSLRGTH